MAVSRSRFFMERRESHMNLTGLNRRMLALILCALLTLGMVPATALASEMETPTDTVSSTEPAPEEETGEPTEVVFETLAETTPETTSETIPETTSQEPEEGWDYDDESQTLTIWENLPDAAYDSSTDLYFAPWDAWILEVRHVVVAPGVTRLGAGFFAEAVALEDISLPDSLTTIGDYAFRSCVSLAPPALSSEVTLGEGVFAYTPLDGESELSLLIDGPVLDSLRISLGEDAPVALNRPFQGEVTSYTAPTPLAVDAALTVEATGSGTITIGDIPGESATITPSWQADGTWSLTVSIARDGVKTDYTVGFISAEAGITGIEIETPPTKTLYQEGEAFDPTGMTVTVHLGEAQTRTVTAEALCCTPQGALSRDVTAIDVTYAGKTVSQPITVLGSLTGSGTQEEPYLLYGEEDIRTLDAWVTAGDARAAGYFRMEEAIELTGTWEGIGDKDHPFTGDFDGGSNQISIPEGGKALFAKTRGAVIHDLKVYGPQIADYGLVSTYAVDKKAPYYAQFLRVTLVSGTQTLKSGFLGGYASGEDSVLIDDCHVEAGVIIGYDKTQKHIGSFGGEFNGEIRGSTSAATVYGTDWVGGIVANKGQSMGDLNVLNCSFTGTLVATGKYVGGIAGAGYAGTGWGMVSAPNAWGVVIKDCTCSGSVTGSNAVGGILGAEACVQQFWDNGQGSILNNRFTGTLTAGDGAYAGGIIGFLQSLNRYMTISGNYYKNGDTGIGAVAHVDTSGVTGGFQDGTFYYDTSKDALETINCVALETYIDLPTIGQTTSGNNRAVSWKDSNRTDDPLGADKEKLCYSDPKIQKYVSELLISGSFETQYTLGQELNLTGIVLTAKWSDGSTTPLTLSDVSLSGYDKNKEGSQTVTLEYQSAKAQFTVNVKPKTNKITVSVAIYGDSKHGEDGTVHGMARGGLTLWGRDTQMEAQTTDTVWDVIQRLAQANGLTIQASFSSKYNSYYIEGVNGLGEYDNGPGSGWMYILNGSHPEVGVSARYVKDGDTIVLHYTDDYNYEEGGVYYGQPLRDASYVDSLIQAIGEPAFTQASKQKIDAARKTYDALSEGQKKKVTRLSILEAAEAKYQELSQAEDANKAKNVINLINKIGTVTASSGDAIEKAQSAYDALTDAQKKLVSNYSLLEKATADWNKAMARQVMDLIEKIPTPITTASKQKIDQARKAYDALSAQQKKLVTNYKTLTQAETAYAKLTASTQDKQDAKTVEDLIASLGTITESARDKVEKARAAYEKLSPLQKQLVENYDVLEAAEEKLTLLASLGKVAGAYVDTGDYMEALGTPAVGTIGGEWMVIGLSRSGRVISGEDSYYAGVETYVRESIDENGRLHKAKSTDNSRLILALTALGRDVTDVAGHNLLQGLSQMDFVKKQGNNGPIWALLALDSGNYPVPQGGDVTRQALVEEILRVQTSDGGWAISGDAADSDMTGMALQALAPYYAENDQVRQAVDKAVDRLSRMQMENGGFGTFSGNGKVETSESVSQVIVALTALGIDPDTDARFVKNGKSALDALLRYALPGGGFRHVPSGELDGMATEQGYYALTAYSRFLEGKTSLYNMTDVIDRGGDVEVPTSTPVETQPQAEPEEALQEKTTSPVLWVVLALALGLGAGIGGTLAIVCLVPKLKQKS